MNSVLVTVLLIFVPWVVLGLVVLGLDVRNRRRYRELLEVRDWQDKVDAMRRMADQEGDA
jgi:hypothetical protein